MMFGIGAVEGLVQQAAAGRSSRGVEKGTRKDVSARALPHQWRQFHAQLDRQSAVLHLPERIASGLGGIPPW